MKFYLTTENNYFVTTEAGQLILVYDVIENLPQKLIQRVFRFTALIESRTLPFLMNLPDISSYSHTITVDGWYDRATFTIPVKTNEITYYMDNLISRQVTFFDPFSNIAWQGFIDKVSVKSGTFQTTIGPVINLINKSRVKFTDISTNAQIISDPITNDVSIAQYGTFELITQAQKLNLTLANQLNQVIVNERSSVEETQNLDTGFDGIIECECLGYYHLLDKYTYYTATDTTTPLTTKLAAVFNAHPDSVYSPYHLFTQNNMSVFTKETEYRTAKTIVEELVSFGSETGYKRMVAGVGPGRVPYYRQVSNETKYSLNLLGQVVSGASVIYPWQLEPGYKISMSNRGYSDTVFIESVQYTAPFTVAINFSMETELKQRIARPFT